MNLDTIPEELKVLDRWICWKREGKQKLPYQVRDPEKKADITIPETWAPFKIARFIVENHAVGGIGTVIADPYILFDFDHCVKNGEIDMQVFGALCLLNTYTEFSQSGEGIHAIGKARKPGKFPDWIECYDSGRFVYITGDLVPGFPSEIREMQGAVNSLYAENKLEDKGSQNSANLHIPQNSAEGRTIAENYGLYIGDIARPEGSPVQIAPGVWKGANPWHGSTSGYNFKIDTGLNIWHCFRHATGGDALIAFAINEGVISCEDAGQGCLDGRWPEVFQALEHRGYHDRTKANVRKTAVIS